MRKRWTITIIIGIVAGMAALAWFYPTTVYVPVGLVKGEATFDGKPTDYWADALNQEGFLGQKPPPGDAGKTLRQGGAAAVPVLCEIARGPDEKLRTEALNALALMGPEAKAAVPLLSNVIKTETNQGRFLLASQAWGNVDPSAAAEALGAVLREPTEADLSRQACACTALIRLAPQGQEAVPALNDIFHNPKTDPVLLVQVIDVLWHMKQPTEPMVPILCEMVSADHSPVGVQALHVLSSLGPNAKSAVPTLVKLLERPTLPSVGRTWGPPHRAAVVRTLGKIGPDASPAVPVLLASLSSVDYLNRVELAQTIGEIGPEAKKAVTIRDAVWAAAVILWASRPPGSLAAPCLIEIERRTWIPRDRQSSKDVRIAIRRIDPGAATRAHLPDYPED
jgi:HEAT repeat protein